VSWGLMMFDMLWCLFWLCLWFVLCSSRCAMFLVLVTVLLFCVLFGWLSRRVCFCCWMLCICLGMVSRSVASSSCWLLVTGCCASDLLYGLRLMVCLCICLGGAMMLVIC